MSALIAGLLLQYGSASTRLQRAWRRQCLRTRTATEVTISGAGISAMDRISLPPSTMTNLS